MLEQALEYTCEGKSLNAQTMYSKGRFSQSVDTGHTDYETISLILGILADFLKSIQPGIQAAEARVRFFTLSENLVFRKTEIIVCPFPWGRSGLKSFHSQDLDFDGENRTVILEGNVGRKEKANASSKERWVDSSAKLLDHYCGCPDSSLHFILADGGFSHPHRTMDRYGPCEGSRHGKFLLEFHPPTLDAIREPSGMDHRASGRMGSQ